MPPPSARPSASRRLGRMDSAPSLPAPSRAGPSSTRSRTSATKPPPSTSKPQPSSSRLQSSPTKPYQSSTSTRPLPPSSRPHTSLPSSNPHPSSSTPHVSSPPRPPPSTSSAIASSRRSIVPNAPTSSRSSFTPSRLSSRIPTHSPSTTILNRRSFHLDSTPLQLTALEMWETADDKLLTKDFTSGQLARSCERLFEHTNWLFWILEGPGSVPLPGDWEEFTLYVYGVLDFYVDITLQGRDFVINEYTAFLLHVMIYVLADWNTETAERIVRALLTEGNVDEVLEEVCYDVYGVRYPRGGTLEALL